MTITPLHTLAAKAAEQIAVMREGALWNNMLEVRAIILAALQSAAAEGAAGAKDNDVEIGETTSGRVYIGLPHFHVSVQIDRDQATRVRDNINRILNVPTAQAGETPRTDATIEGIGQPPGPYRAVVRADFARQLERELNVMSAESQRNREAAQMWAAKAHAPTPAALPEVRNILETHIGTARPGERQLVDHLLAALAPHLSATAREDGERLDWLEANHGNLYRVGMYKWCLGVVGPKSTVREVIDASRAKEQS